MRNSRKSLSVVIYTFLIFLAVMVIPLFVQAHPALSALNITVTTDKQTYKPQQTVQVYGNLTNDGSPVDGLVALQISDPSDKKLILRTLSTGPSPPVGNISITEVVPCDMGGNPKNSFNKNTFAYFNVTVNNSGTTWENAMISINTYNINNRPFGIAAITAPISPGPTTWWMQSISIPDWVSSGTGAVYASVFTDSPQVGGVAYCPEGSATYQIVGDTMSLESQEPTIESLMSTLGSYNLTFKLPPGSEEGTYDVYVSSSYQELHDDKTATFLLTLPGDANGDGKVDLKDLVILAKAWYSQPGDPKWDPRADFNNDNIVNLSDLVRLAKNWYQTL